jgi:hypothetical protein
MSMPVLILVCLLMGLPTFVDASDSEARMLLDTIEALQQPVEDFRCEYEGTMYFKNQAAEGQKLGDDGLFDTFSGVFIWKRGGDTHSESLHRNGGDNTIARESLVVRVKEQQAEEYYRQNDAPLGYAVIKNPKEANSWKPGCLGEIFLIDKMKREVANEEMKARVRDDQLDGRPLKVLTIALRMDGEPDIDMMEFWIDLRRNGHVVRHDMVDAAGKAAQLDIELAPFRAGRAEVWMPVSGEFKGYAALVDNQPVIVKEPTVLWSMRVVAGTMEFNRHPGRDVFTMKYKPGTPISDQLRKLTTEFGEQKIGAKPTKSEAEKMLNEQVARAEAQKSELVVASPSEGFDWTSWLPWLFGAAVLASSIVLLWSQRRGA